MANIIYTAPPTCSDFMLSQSFGRIILGPVGSGKTTACIMELFRRACEQVPAPDGMRYTRFAIVRQTLKQLKDTVLKDCLDWLGPVANYKVSESTIHIETDDVRSEWIMIPLEDPIDQKRLLSMQLTASWMSEAIEMDVGLVAAISGRIPRYPAGNRGTPTWHGIIADTNFPTEGSDWHKFVEEGVPDWQVFKQPSGLSPEAENLDWLNQTTETKRLPLGDPERVAQGRKYYERLARNPNPDWVRRYVLAEFGNDPSGVAVFAESFKRAYHVVDELEPVSQLPLIIGQDGGRDPWSVICQLDHYGALRVLEEVPAENIALEDHIDRSLRPALMKPQYLGRPICVVMDPSMMAKDNLYEVTAKDLFAKKGFMAFPGPTNDPEQRIAAIDSFLLGQRNGKPAMMFSKTGCPQVIAAMAGEYRYARMKSGQRKPLPDKNEASHRIDALQYAALAAHGGMVNMMASRVMRPRRTKKQHVTAGAWT